MTTYTIHIERESTGYAPYKYIATFDDYDGAPIDHETPSRCPIGTGDTELEALLNLAELAFEREK